jgi:hypothetical protein
LVTRIWEGCDSGSHRYGEGTVYCTQDTHYALGEMKILPDIEMLSGDVRLAPVSTDAIDGVHRRVGNTDVYFLRSSYSSAKTFRIALRARGIAELWDPVNGTIFRADQKAAGARTELEITLPAYGSTAVVFVGESTAPAVPQLLRKETAAGAWSLEFPKQRPFAVNSLGSWTQLKEHRYFSGTAKYSGTVSVPKLAEGERACLHFGAIREIGVVQVEGATPSTLWTFPYQSCVTSLPDKAVHVSVEVTNLWHNRLVGDAQVASNLRTLKTNIALPSPEDPLMPSGIMEPVEWWIYK